MALTTKAKRRLLRFCRFMEQLPKKAAEHFSMGVWFTHEGKGHDHGFKDGSCLTRRKLMGCGTQACALGWAASLPEFRKVGLEIRFDEYGSPDIMFDGESEDPYVAGAMTFDISRAQAVELFSLVGRCKKANTPHEWAAAARGLVREWK